MEAGLYHGAELALSLFHSLHQPLEARVAVGRGPGAGDVGGVAVAAGPGVQQEYAAIADVLALAVVVPGICMKLYLRVD